MALVKESNSVNPLQVIRHAFLIGLASCSTKTRVEALDWGPMAARTAHSVRKETEGSRGMKEDNKKKGGSREEGRVKGKNEGNPGGRESNGAMLTIQPYSLALQQGPNTARLDLTCLLSHS